MCADSGFRKSGSPRASTEVTSLQQNKLQNKEALEKGLRCRRSIKELVNQGILLSPSISHPDKVRQLQRAKTSDLLKHKIEKRPDRQQLINRRIIRDDKPGTSPYILEQCHNLEKYQLKTALNSKLTTRPGTLELVEKGVLQVDPGVDSLIRCGSIPYPRVQSVNSSENVSTAAETIPSPPPLISIQPSPSSACTSTKANASSRGKGANSSSTSRSMKDETVVYKLGSLVFHNYCPKSAQSLSPNVVPPASFQQKQKAREAQQVELLRLQDTARVHRLVEQELSRRAALRHELSIDQGNSPVEAKADGFGVTSLSSHSPSLVTITPLNSPLSLSAVSSTESTHSNPHQNLLNSDMTMQSPVPISPSVNFSPCSAVSELGTTHSLEQLSVLQLRSECRERRLTISGSKSTLIRQLEPYRDQILSKYFLNKDSKPVKYSNTDSCEPMPTSHQFPLLQPKKATPPVWQIPKTESGQPVSGCIPIPDGPHMSSSLITTQNRFVFCSPSFTSLNSTASNQSINPQISLITPSSTGNVLNVGLPLRHANSAPHMVDVIHPQQTSNQNVFPATCAHMSSVASTSLILVQVANNSSFTTVPSHSIPISVSQRSSFLPPPASCQQSSVYFASSLVPLCQTPGVLSVSSSTQQSNTAAYPPAPTGFVSSHCQPNEHSSNNTVQEFNSVSESTTEAQKMVLPQFRSPSMPDSDVSLPKFHLSDQSIEMEEPCQTPPISQVPTLVQIEQIWLRVRQLRRRIAKEQNMDIQPGMKCEEPEGRSKRLQALIQEHDQLAVLCRLLVIERIDALDELMDSGVESGSSDLGFSSSRLLNSTSPPCSNINSSGLQVERNLLYSYVRKLGGTALVNCVSSPVGRSRRSSSPLLNCKPSFEDSPCSAPAVSEAKLCENGLTAAPCVLTSTPRSRYVHAEPNSEISDCNRVHMASSWSNGLQTLHDHPLMHHDYGITREDVDLTSEPMEPPPSPLTTDALFELWDSVLKDTPKANEAGSPESLLASATESTHSLISHPQSMEVQTDSPAKPTTSGMEILPAVRTLLSPKATNFCRNSSVNIPQQTTNHAQSVNTDDAKTSHCVQNDWHVRGDASSFDCSSGQFAFSTSGPGVKSFIHSTGYHAETLVSPTKTLWPSLQTPNPSMFSDPTTNHSFEHPSDKSFALPGPTFSSQVPPAELADALFTSLDSADFAELMDTVEPIGMSPMVMNWTIDT